MCRVWTVLAVLAVCSVVALTTVWLLDNKDYSHQPVSAYIWYGGLTHNSVTFKTYGNLPFQLLLDDDESGSTIVYNITESESSFTVTNLTPNTAYSFIYGDGSDNTYSTGTLTTLPPPNTRFNFTIAAGGCAHTGSQNKVFTDILQAHHPLLFLHLGDLHYNHVLSDDIQERQDNFRYVLASSTQSQLFRNTAMVYMWDDHDYMDNNARYKNTTARDVAVTSYRQFVPSYPLANPQQAPYHAFTIGTVRFIVSDVRSESTNEQIMTNNYDFILWVTSKPWGGPAEDGNDGWRGWQKDRAELSNFLSNGTTNVLAVSSDAHMLAFDDGSHTYFGSDNATPPPRSFPILHAGPLDRIGSVKGGIFSKGCTTILRERNHQYGTIRYEWDGNSEPCLIVAGWSAPNNDLVFEQRLCGTNIYQQPNANPGSCSVQYLSTGNWVVLSFAFVCMLLAIGVGFFAFGCVEGLGLAVLTTVGVVFTAAVGIGTSLLRGITNWQTFAIAIVLLVETFAILIALSCLAWREQGPKHY